MNTVDCDPKYTEMCSTQTVQSHSDGFFQELFESILGQCTEKWLKTRFAEQPTDFDKIRCMFEDEGDKGPGDLLQGMLEHVAEVYKPKNAVFSGQRRREAERMHETKGDQKKALMLLHQAVLRAPPKGDDISSDGGITLALALWARSAVLLEFGNGPGALCDLQHSLVCGLPAKQHGAYYVRLAKAHALIGDKAKVEICLKLAEKFCQDSETLRGIEEIRSQFDSIVPKEDPKSIDVPTVTSGANARLESASSLLDLADVASRGKHFVARDNVKTGNILLVEKPSVSALLHTQLGTHCLHCMKRLVVPYGCPECSGVAFCSLECRDTACATYHRFECKFMDLLIGSGMSVLCFLALRAVTQCASPAEAIEQGRKIIGDLCGHSNQRLPEDFLRRGVMAAFLMSILQRSGFFGQRKAGSIKPTLEELEVAEVLLGLLQVLQFNAHEIYETKLSEKHRFNGSKQCNIGVALYKTGAFFNHDCNPSVGRYFVGTTLVLAACQPVLVGETVGENYGHVFTKRSLTERRRSLTSRYWFRCECRACREDWQVLPKLTNRCRLRCPVPNCSGIHYYPDEPIKKTVKCVKCQKMVCLEPAVSALRQCEEYYRRGAECMKQNETENAICEFIHGIELFHAFCVPPHKNTQIAQESLRLCLADRGTVVELP